MERQTRLLNDDEMSALTALLYRQFPAIKLGFIELFDSYGCILWPLELNEGIRVFAVYLHDDVADLCAISCKMGF